MFLSLSIVLNPSEAVVIAGGTETCEEGSAPDVKLPDDEFGPLLETDETSF